MKNLRNQLLTLLLVSLNTLWAHDFETDGIYYNITDAINLEVEVTFRGSDYSEYLNEYSGELVIPSTVSFNGTFYSVTKLGDNAFRDCSELQSIILGNNITRIGNYSFYGCNSLKTVINFSEFKLSKGSAGWGYLTYYANRVINAPNGSVEGDFVFSTVDNKHTLVAYLKNTSIMYDDWTSKILGSLYQGTTQSKTYTFNAKEGDVVSFDWKASCSGYETLIVKMNDIEIVRSKGSGGTTYHYFGSCKHTVTNSGEQTLYVSYYSQHSSQYAGGIYNVCLQKEETTEYADIIIPSDYKGDNYNIGSNVFYGCRNISNITIPNGVTQIDASAFRHCTSLTNITIPNSVISIGESAFRDCDSLNKIAIGSGVSKIGNSAFSNCKSLKELYIEDGEDVLSLGYGIYYGVLSSAGGYTNGGGLFHNSPLEYIYMGRDLSYNTDFRYGYSPFNSRTNLKTVVVGPYVSIIGTNLFRECTLLSDIYFSSNPQISTNAIPTTTNRHLTLYDSHRVSFDISNVNTYSDASYTRKIEEGQYGTIMLPFAPDALSLENYAFYELSESGDTYMKFDEVTNPVANTPYIYTLREGKENLAITGGKTIISSKSEVSTIDAWETVGSFTNQTIDTNDGNYYALSADANEINRIANNLTVLPFRAYFKGDNIQKTAMRLYVSDTTGIKEITSYDIDKNECDDIFDLYGRKILNPLKGYIYIKNGKKIIF